MSITHSDPVIQSIITAIEMQRDTLLVENAGLKQSLAAAATKKSDDALLIANLQKKADPASRFKKYDE